MNAAIRIRFVGALAIVAVLLPASARAHEMSMAEMDVRETAPGEFLWQWSAQNDKRPIGDSDQCPRLTQATKQFPFID